MALVKPRFLDSSFSALSTQCLTPWMSLSLEIETDKVHWGVFPFLFSFNNNKQFCAVTHKMLITLPFNNSLSVKLLAWSVTHLNNKKPFPFQYTFNFLFLINIQWDISICGISLLIYCKLILFHGNVTRVALLIFEPIVLHRTQQLFASSGHLRITAAWRVIRKDSSLNIEAILKVGFIFLKHKELNSDEMITYNSYFIGDPAWDSLSLNKAIACW